MNIKKQLHKIANYYDVLSKENARLNDLIDEYIQERDYLDARCAALENDLVLDDVVSKAENEKLKEALSNLFEACLAADVEGELSERINGEILDAVHEALEVTK